jgi:predicted nucleic acid-binding protein
VQVLVDTSVWLDYFTGRPSPEADHLHALLGRSPLLVADVVLMEVLLALPDELHRRQAKEALAKFWHIEVSGHDLAEKTAVSYHTLRARGLPVNPAECRLATFCIDQGFALLHSSAGYEPFERHMGLRVVGR